MNRRETLQRAGLFALASTPLLMAGAQDAGTGAAAKARSRKFTIDLTPGAIGIKASPPEVIELAARFGFESVQPNGAYLASLEAAERKEMFAGLSEKGLVWGAAGLPVDFRGDEARFREGLAVLPEQAAALQEVGASRISTWLKPFHDSLTYLANFEQHSSRLREITRILSDHGLRFGLEYVGTYNLWTSKRHAFVHTLAETRELIAEVDVPGLGVVLDSWHWHTAGETADDLLTLTNEDIVACDLNDAPEGVANEDLQDNRRELPAATGVIDAEAFLGTLLQLGYDGPVRAEPFNQPLNQLDNEAAAEATATALKKAIASVER